jgi:preprotein translocase subunit SecG
MNLVESAVLVLHVLTALAVCGFVLLQHGKGADMGAAFGSGSSGSLFGAAGSANFLSRTTAVLATVFFATSVALTYFGSQHGVPQGVMEKGVMERAVPAKPADVPQPAPGTGAAPAPSGAAPAEVPK